MKMHKSLTSLGLAAALGFLGCNSSSVDTATPDAGTPQPDLASVDTTGAGVANAFNHDGILGDIGDVFADGRQVSAAVGERMHACGKLQYAALGRILQTRGVNITNATTFSAGLLYSSGNLVIGVANYPARVLAL